MSRSIKHRALSLMVLFLFFSSITSVLIIPRVPIAKAVGKKWLSEFEHIRSLTIDQKSGIETNFRIDLSVNIVSSVDSGCDNEDKIGADFDIIFSPNGESNVRSLLIINSTTALIGTEEGGQIWMTTNGGTSWTKKFDGYEAPNYVSDIRRFTQINSTRILATTTNWFNATARILESNDVGQTWSIANSIAERRALDIIHFGNGTLLVGSRNPTIPPTSDIWRSNDYGEKWSEISTPDSDAENNGEALLYLGSGIVLAGTGSNEYPDNNGKIFKSSDGGYTWNLVLDAGDDGMCTALYKTSTGRILAGFRDSGSIYYSDNDGVTWTEATIPSSALRILDFIEFTDATLNRIILASAGDGLGLLYKSIDDGVTWSFYMRLSGESSYCIGLFSEATDTILAGFGSKSGQGRVYKGNYVSVSSVNIWVKIFPIWLLGPLALLVILYIARRERRELRQF